MTYVIIHGSFGHPSENWFPYLKEQLEALGQKVIVPQFPVDNWDVATKNGPDVKPQQQSLDSWLKAFEPIYEQIKNDPQICFVGHSIACVFILHLVMRYNLQLDSAIFASPFISTLGGENWQFDWINNSFYKTDFNQSQLKKLVPVSYALYSKSDPYVSEPKVLEFVKLMGSSLIEINSGGHLGASAGFTKFPLVLELCKTRFPQ